MPSEDSRDPRRETRLLLAIIVVSVGVLLLLARFRFPEQSEPQPADPAPAPLERLAARAAFDELASTMADVERRIAGSVAVLRVSPERASGGYIVAPRVTSDRAVAVLLADERISSTDGTSSLLTRDIARDLVVIGVPSSDDGVVTPRTGPPRTAPRYVAVVEATRQGPAVRPVYVGRTMPVNDPRTPLLSFSAVQSPIQRGAAIFSLDGAFIGLVAEAGSTVSLIAGDFLRSAAEAAQPSDDTVGNLGLEVQPLSQALSRATGADRGVMVAYVEPQGPSARLVRAGDVIQSLDGTAITTVAGLRQIERTRTPGADVSIVLVRERATRQLTVRATDAATLAVPTTTDDHGVVGRAVAGEGVEVIALRSGSPAAAAGLQRGDLIVILGSAQAPAPADLTRVFRTLKPGEAVLVGVHRGPEHRILALEKR